MPSTSTPPPRRPAKGPPPAPRKGKSPPPRSDSTGPLGFFANNSQYCLTPASNPKTCSAAVAGKSADSGDPEVSSKPPPSMKKGGMVKKTGLYKLHKGELVVPTRNVTKVKKALKS